MFIFQAMLRLKPAEYIECRLQYSQPRSTPIRFSGDIGDSCLIHFHIIICFCRDSYLLEGALQSAPCFEPFLP